MNIEIANRLVNLRKSNNLSQEALAEKLGISRQAVSKWERAEASPDTDNLILLARLYQISLDELLKTEDEIPMPETAQESEEDAALEGEGGTEETAECAVQESEGMAGETAGADPAQISEAAGQERGDAGSENGESEYIDKNNVYVDGRKYERDWSHLYSFPVPLIILVVYMLIGCIYGAWHPGWILFLLVPIWYSLVSAICSGNANCFAWPVMAAFLYLCMGIFGGLWHPGWVIFLTVPLYYTMISWVDSVRGRRKDRWN